MAIPNISSQNKTSTNQTPLNQTTDNDVVPVDSIFDNIRIVMVNTTLPANIGSAARAMLTMGLEHLVVVSPKLPIDDTSVAHAAGAKSVLENCQVVDSIEEAIADCQLVFAASSRQRHVPRPVVSPLQAAEIITSQAKSSLPKVAVLFGREDRGLTNDELAIADYHIQIEANPNYPVLNVASAVQVIAGFFYHHISGYNKQLKHNTNDSKPNDIHLSLHDDVNDQSGIDAIDIKLRQHWDVPAVNQQQKSELQHRTIELMYALELIESTDKDKLRELPSRLSRLLSRLQLDQKEYELLNTVIAKIKRKI